MIYKDKVTLADGTVLAAGSLLYHPGNCRDWAWRVVSVMPWCDDTLPRLVLRDRDGLGVLMAIDPTRDDHHCGLIILHSDRVAKEYAAGNLVGTVLPPEAVSVRVPPAANAHCGHAGCTADYRHTHEAILWVTGEMLADAFFRQGSPGEYFRICSDGIPQDARFVGKFDDPLSNRIALIYSHPSFKPVRDGRARPDLRSPMFETLHLSEETLEFVKAGGLETVGDRRLDTSSHTPESFDLLAERPDGIDVQVGIGPQALDDSAFTPLTLDVKPIPIAQSGQVASVGVFGFDGVAASLAGSLEAYMIRTREYLAAAMPKLAMRGPDGQVIADGRRVCPKCNGAKFVNLADCDGCGAEGTVPA